MAKMTVHAVLTAIEEVRHQTCPPDLGETKVRGIDQIIAADRMLLDLQEQLLNDYGDDPQDTELAS